MNKTKQKRHPDQPASDTADAQPQNEAGAQQSGLVAQPARSEPDPAQEIAALKDQALRLRADYDNYRKRMLREMNEMREQANADLVSELLPVLDHMKLGMEAATRHKADKAILDGMQMILAQFMGVLAKFGLAQVETVGKPYDPAMAEAVNTVHSDEVAEGVVLAETRAGYTLNKRLIRPAQVVVSSGPAIKTPPHEPAAEHQGRQAV